jgi:hypothetical protein
MFGPWELEAELLGMLVGAMIMFPLHFNPNIRHV